MRHTSWIAADTSRVSLCAHPIGTLIRIARKRLGFVGWLVVLKIYVALVVFQPYSDLKWKQEITNLWNSIGETGNRTPDLLLFRPRAQGIPCTIGFYALTICSSSTSCMNRFSILLIPDIYFSSQKSLYIFHYLSMYCSSVCNRNCRNHAELYRGRFTAIKMDEIYARTLIVLGKP